MKDEVLKAIDEIKTAFAGCEVSFQPDNDGGAYVFVENVEIGDSYNHETSWFGFRVTFQYPYADVYPHFIRGDIERKDGKPLGEATSKGQTFIGRPAIQISRRSNRYDPAVDTAALKLLKVQQWFKTRP